MKGSKAEVIFAGLENIGRPFNRSGRTIRRWIKSEGFPAGQLPNNEWATTLPLISDWVLARAGKIDRTESAKEIVEPARNKDIA